MSELEWNAITDREELIRSRGGLLRLHILHCRPGRERKGRSRSMVVLATAGEGPSALDGGKERVR
jgi:hypothetical protein